MNAHTASLINAFTLIVMGGWGYFGSLNPSPTSLIPVIVGVLILVCNNGIKFEHKILSHIAVVLTLLIALALFMPLKGAIGREDTLAIIRIGLMIATSIFAMVYFIRSFSAAKKARQAKG